MNERRAPIRASDLRGAARLATDATAGLTDLVEAMHERIARLPGIPAATPPGRTRGITGLVYKTIRGVTHVVGGSVDALLGLLAPALGAGDPMPQREAVIAALAAHLPQATGRVAVMIHGLCMNDLQWQRDGHDHGALLARELGFTPLYLHYNSGLHVSVNGRALARQLEQLVDQWPQPVERLVLLGHSMGGLLARSAMHYGAQAGHRWLAQLSDAVFIGTPHHGAPLERAGHWIDTVLGATPYAAPLARLGKLRSAGITDLRHGNLVDEDWTGDDRTSNGADRRQPLPLPAGVRCHAIASSLGSQTGEWKERLLGDGLVPLDSALGRHRDAARCLAFAPERQWVGQGIGHLDLLKDAGVAAQLLRWLR
jgi:pimeloyl-ACP methyl ester carboxylesterase